MPNEFTADTLRTRYPHLYHENYWLWPYCFPEIEYYDEIAYYLEASELLTDRNFTTIVNIVCAQPDNYFSARLERMKMIFKDFPADLLHENQQVFDWIMLIVSFDNIKAAVSLDNILFYLENKQVLTVDSIRILAKHPEQISPIYSLLGRGQPLLLREFQLLMQHYSAYAKKIQDAFNNATVLGPVKYERAVSAALEPVMKNYIKHVMNLTLASIVDKNGKMILLPKEIIGIIASYATLDEMAEPFKIPLDPSTKHRLLLSAYDKATERANENHAEAMKKKSDMNQQ